MALTSLLYNLNNPIIQTQSTYRLLYSLHQLAVHHTSFEASVFYFSQIPFSKDLTTQVFKPNDMKGLSHVF